MSLPYVSLGHRVHCQTIWFWQKQSSFKTVSKLFCFSLISLCRQFKLHRYLVAGSRTMWLYDLPMRWPYIDLFFYESNTTHVWNTCPWFPDEAWRFDTVFPLRRRPFAGLWIPAPCNTQSVLEVNFDLRRCRSVPHRRGVARVKNCGMETHGEHGERTCNGGLVTVMTVYVKISQEGVIVLDFDIRTK